MGHGTRDAAKAGCEGVKRVKSAADDDRYRMSLARGTLPAYDDKIELNYPSSKFN
jgi:hypothetical protein